MNIFFSILFAVCSLSAEKIVRIVSDFNIEDLSLSQNIYKDTSLRVTPQMRDIRELPALLKEADKFVVFNQIVHSTILSKVPKEKLIFFLWEPWEIPEKYYAHFSRVYTWDDALVDNVKFFRVYAPNLMPMEESLPPFEKKKFCVMIAGSDFDPPDRKNDLYSERMRMVEFFETKPEGKFDIYGRSWSRRKYRDYRSPIPGGHSGKEKISVLKNYRFSICFENTKNINGYITEKIFGCFAAGCLPIYWGAENVTDYIPANCFIDYRNFSSREELYSFLENMTRKQYDQYIQNIRAFLKTEKARLFSTENFQKIFHDALE